VRGGLAGVRFSAESTRPSWQEARLEMLVFAVVWLAFGGPVEDWLASRENAGIMNAERVKNIKAGLIAANFLLLIGSAIAVIFYWVK
jgi:hypothetical protein